MFERFTDRARKAMALANQEAQRLNHEYIGPEHILLGLLDEGYGVAATLLKNLDVDFAKARLEVEKLAPRGSTTVAIGKLPQTIQAKKVVELTIHEARNLNHNYVGTEHLLLGLLALPESIAAQVLASFGLKLEAVREVVLNLLEPGAHPAGSSAPAPEAAGLSYLHVGPERMTRLQQLAAHRNKDVHQLAAEILDDWLKWQR
jgi:ATP-dependent Clp protease ATP-binding subunit ClpC